MHMKLWELLLCGKKTCGFIPLLLWHDPLSSPITEVLIPSIRHLPGSYTQTGTCRVPARPYWVWRALVVCSLALTWQTHRKPPLLASTITTWHQTSNLCYSLNMLNVLWEAGESLCLCARVVKTGLLPAWVAVLQWTRSLGNSQPRDRPENMPEVTVISFSWVSVMVKSTSFNSNYSFYPRSWL